MTRLRRLDLAAATASERRALTRRSAVPDPVVRANATSVVLDIAERGHPAVAEYAERFGGGFEGVDNVEVRAAFDRQPAEVQAALSVAAETIRSYHERLVPADLEVETVSGVRIQRRWVPLDRVGAYVPGGKAVYPSTVLMTVIPAVVAGVSEIAVATPAGFDGRVPDVTLAACAVAGATEVWCLGGAQAIGALAHGAGTLRPVRKIVGPGGAWVTAAKLAVLGVCGIDLPAGPSEVLVVADATADATLVAADLLCQAEHGPDSPAILVTTDPDLPDRVEAELDRILPDLARAAILEEALANHGYAVIAPNTDAALDFANEYAAEHVTVMTADSAADAAHVTAAGSIYVGRHAPESAGDYATGANHVLPTGGLAAAYGPLSVEDFGSWRQVQHISRTGLAAIVDVIGTLADAEGLAAHRLAAELRMTQEGAS